MRKNDATTNKYFSLIHAEDTGSNQISDAPAQPAQSESNNSLTPTVVKTTTTQVEEPPMAANSVQPPVDPAFFDFDFDSLLASLETCPSIFAQDTSNTGNQFTTYDRTFDPAVFGLPGGDFNALMLSNSSAPTTDPLDEFMTMYGFSDIMSSDGAASSFVSGAPFNNELPLLPPPPPESPPAPSPTVEHPSESVPRSRCARKEVDEANIIYSTRSRAPTARKRFADEELSDRPTKKRRASKVYLFMLLFCSFSEKENRFCSDTRLKWRRMSLLVV
jgi:hypothetical protein